MPALSRRKFVASILAGGAAVAVGGQVVATRVGAQPAAEQASGEVEVPRLIPTVCGMCDVNCGVLAYVKGDRLVKLEGNYAHSHSHGRICARGSAGVKLLYDADRLKAPLKRVGAGKFERISWQQAFAEIGQSLANLRGRYGPQTLAWVRHPDPCDDWDRQFAAAFGTPNLFTHNSVGRSARDIACRATLGWVPMSDLRRTRFALFCGRNVAEGMFTADVEALMAAKESGAKIVVVDPRLTNTAAQAHEWVPIRPGTDGALLLGLMHVIVAERLYDERFVEANVVGFEELRDYLADKTPGWAATETDVSSATIARLAREMAAAKPACVVDPGMHGAWGALYSNSLNSARAALALNALLGTYGAEGGLLRPLSFAEGLGRFEPPPVAGASARRADGADEIDPALLPPDEGFVRRLPDIILSEQPYPIKALVVRHFNPARSLPNSRKVREALAKLDLLVVIDVMPSDTAELAHYVLPESTYLERTDPPLLSRSTYREVSLRQPVVSPLHDTLPPADIVAGLARAAGIGQYFDFSVETVTAARLEGLGIGLDRLRSRGVWREEAALQQASPTFGTPSGKIELVSERLRAAGFDALPVYRPTLVQPGNGNAFRLLHGRQPYHTGTATQNNEWLHALAHENRLQINARRAARLDIRDGDEVVVSSDAGEVRLRVQVTEGIHPQAAFLAHGYGTRNPAQRLAVGCGVNDNDLVVDHAEIATVGAATCETIVRVVKA